MTLSTLTHFKLLLPVTWSPSAFISFSVSCFFEPVSVFLCLGVGQCNHVPRYQQGLSSELHQQISWHSSINLVTQFWWCAGQAHHTRIPTDANAKSPCQLDMTHATLHTHHCDNPVIINTNLSASARGAKVLWSRRKGDGGGRGKGRHTKYRSWSDLSGSGIWH